MPDGDPAFDRIPEADNFVCNAWSKCGRAFYGGMGATPLPFSEIQAYAKSNPLDSWEVNAIRLMSEKYCSALGEYKDYYSAPPKWTRKEAIDRMRESSLLKMEEERP